MPTPEEIERLGISAGTPVAEHIRTGYTATDKPVRVMISIIPGDTLILQYKIPTGSEYPRDKRPQMLMLLLSVKRVAGDTRCTAVTAVIMRP
jgi:hypothetical protein